MFFYVGKDHILPLNVDRANLPPFNTLPNLVRSKLCKSVIPASDNSFCVFSILTFSHKVQFSLLFDGPAVSSNVLRLLVSFLYHLIFFHFTVLLHSIQKYIIIIWFCFSVNIQLGVSQMSTVRRQVVVRTSARLFKTSATENLQRVRPKTSVNK